MEGTDWVGIALGLAFGIPLGIVVLVVFLTLWPCLAHGFDEFE